MKLIFKLSGSIFALATSTLFYISLYVAAFSNFKVIVDFNHFGEGLFELILFTIILPLIIYSVYVDVKNFTKTKPKQKIYSESASFSKSKFL